MKCSYPNCNDIISKPLVCKTCNSATYCSNNCRVQDFYKGHSKICKSKNPASVSTINPPTLKDAGLASFKPEPPEVSRSFNSMPQVAKAKVPKPEPSPLDAYEVSSKILGSGAYGQVKLVKLKTTGESRALKIISKHSLEEEKLSKDKIFEEITNHQQLKHKNIIKYIDHFEDSQSIYIVLEYAERGSLFERIKNKSKIPENQAKIYFKQTIEGIKYLHSCDIIHRDIKPENILISSQDLIKICDFGWCVKGGEMRSTFCGTLDYMAPEMVKGQPHSFEVDIWALGVLLYEMLHGYAPFEGMREADKCYKIVNGKLNFEDISPEARDLINRMIQVNPRDRIKLNEVLDHKFFAPAKEEGEDEDEEEEGKTVLVGTGFRYYVQNYGMDDGVVEGVSDDMCIVGFKKSGMKMKLSSDEVLRRVARTAKKEAVKPNEIEVGKVAKIAETFESRAKDQGRGKPTEDQQKKVLEEKSNTEPNEINSGPKKNEKSKQPNIKNENLNAKSTEIKSFIIKEEKAPRPVDKSQVIKSESPKKNLVPVGVFEKLKLLEKQESALSQSESESESDVVIKSKNWKEGIKQNQVEKPVPVIEPNPEHENIFARLSQLAEEEENEKDHEGFKISLIKTGESSSKSNPYLNQKEIKPNNFLLEKLEESRGQPFSSAAKQKIDLTDSKQNYSPFSSFSSFPINRSESPVRNPRHPNPVITNTNPQSESTPKEYQIYNSLDAYIKAPVTRKRPKAKKDKSPRDKSLDKSLERFKETYMAEQEPPVIAKNPFVDITKVKEIPDKSSSPKFVEEESEVGASGVFFKMDQRKKSPNFREQSESSSEENIFIKKIRENMKKNEDEESDQVFPINRKDENPKSKVKFPIEVSPGKSEKQPATSPVQPKPSPKQSSPIRNPSPKSSQNIKPLKSVSPAPNQNRRSPLSKSGRKKGKNFEDMREKIESMHGNYYESIEEAWIDKQVVLTAREMSDNEYDETGNTRTFSQYDEIFKNPPSVVGNYEDSNVYFKESRDKLENQKKELQEMIDKLDKEKNLQIKIRREKKDKDGFLNWLGNIIGCSERY